MKKTFTILFLLLSFGLFSQEVFYIHTVNVPSENQENFENIMTNYVTELAQDEVSKGTIKAWYLMKRVPNIGENNPDSMNYLWIHVFDNYETIIEPFGGSFGFSRYLWEIKNMKNKKYIIDVIKMFFVI